jgi:hypothetical protein
LKKIAAILLLGILLFNWCGYRWVLNWMEQKANHQLEARLDSNDYNESQLIEIRLPLNMPYLTTQAEFERCDGQVEVNGKHYNYVKRKIDNGQLVLKCIPNETKQRLQSAGDNFFKLVNDLQQDRSAKKSTDGNTGAFKNLTGDYDNQPPAAFVAALYTAAAPPYGVLAAPSLTHLLKATPEQPPEA